MIEPWLLSLRISDIGFGHVSRVADLKEHEAEVQSSAVLELGCGTGACGMYAAALGARRVTLTDGGSNALLALARANVRANCLSGHWAASGTKMNWAPSNTKVEVVAYRWGERPEDGHCMLLAG